MSATPTCRALGKASGNVQPRPGGPRLSDLGAGPLILVLSAALAPRFLHVWAPIVGWQSWRQADTAAIARNFYRTGFNLLCPAIDWSGAGPGYVEAEFPLFPFIAAGLYQLFGLHIVCGRVLALFFSVCAALYLARLCARYVDRWTAGCAAAAFSLCPVSGYIGVAFMPESLLLLALAAIDHMDRWSLTGQERDRVLSGAFLATAIAVKLPALFLGAPIAFMVWRRLGWRMIARPDVWLYAAGTLIPPALWYAHAHRLKAMTGLTFGIWEIGSGGRRRDLGTFKWWLLGGVVYVLVVARGNAVHDYYQLPLLLP